MKSLFPKRKNKKKLPVRYICRNCGAQLSGRYCHNCGQDLFAGGEKTVGEILYHTADTVFALDNKIIKTMKYLIFYPGKLTKDFFSGRVIRYVYPAKLFWFITILFFAGFNIGGSSKEHNEEGQALEVLNKDKVNVKEQEEATADSIEEYIEKTISIGYRLKFKKLSKTDATLFVSEVQQNFVNYIPYVMFLLVPFFAFLLFILFYKKKKYYASHMIFALHFHSFVFLFFTVYILINDFIPDTWEDLTTFILLSTPAIYLTISLYVAYRPSVPKLIWKIPLIMLSYGIICLAALVAFAVAMIRIAEITQGINVLS